MVVMMVCNEWDANKYGTGDGSDGCSIERGCKATRNYLDKSFQYINCVYYSHTHIMFTHG